MSWSNLLKIIEEIAGADVASQIERRARLSMGGQRITISKKPKVTLQMINDVSPGNVKKAAKTIGVSHETVYRVMRRNRLVR